MKNVLVKEKNILSL